MFWTKDYTPAQNIEALLEKENATVEEFLDEDDILQECKSLKKSIVNYFTRPHVIKRLIELITKEPPEDLPMAQRFRHANMACEILTLGMPSLDEKLLADEDTLKMLYSYLEREPPLNPLLSSFLSKTFHMLFTKKNGQDWFLYQTMCLKLLEFIKSQKNFLDLICKHFATPIIPDLIMQMMQSVQGGQLKRNLYEWLTEDKLVKRLIAILGDPQETEKHANVADFFCDLIQQGRSMRQNDQENDSFEVAFEESNPILQEIESTETIEALLNVILQQNAPESTIVSGISVVLTLIRPVVLADEPNSDRLKYLQQREKEIHEKLLTTVIHAIVPHLKEFNMLLRNPPKKPDIVTSAATLSPPFGITRLQICTLFTALLQTRNEDVSKAICETAFFNTLFAFFKTYCWNNLLHHEVESCIKIVFSTDFVNSTQGSTIVNDGSFETEIIDKGDIVNVDSNETKPLDRNDAETNSNPPIMDDYDESNKENIKIVIGVGDFNDRNDSQQKDNLIKDGGEPHHDNNTHRVNNDTAPSALQTHVIVECELIRKLIECWMYNKESEAGDRKRRLGFMGHLIEILKHISNSISENEQIGALIESSLSEASDVALWQSIINPNDGDFTKALSAQNKMLANVDAQECNYNISNFSIDDFTNDDTERILVDEILNISATSEEVDFIGNDYKPMFGVQFRKSPDMELFNIESGGMQNYIDPFNDANFYENFADFDAHFMNSIANPTDNIESNGSVSAADADADTDMDMSANANAPDSVSGYEGAATAQATPSHFDKEEYDKNANVNEKPISVAENSNNMELTDSAGTNTSTVTSTAATATTMSNQISSSEADMNTMQILQDRLESLSLDYSDDEGMWTKPLGQYATQANDTDSTLKRNDDDDDGDDDADNTNYDNQTEQMFANGPIMSKTDQSGNIFGHGSTQLQNSDIDRENNAASRFTDVMQADGELPVNVFATTDGEDKFALSSDIENESRFDANIDNGSKKCANVAINMNASDEVHPEPVSLSPAAAAAAAAITTTSSSTQSPSPSDAQAPSPTTTS